MTQRSGGNHAQRCLRRRRSLRALRIAPETGAAAAATSGQQSASTIERMNIESAPIASRPLAPAAAPGGARAEFARHRDYLLRVARRHLRDRALAEDLVHDALLAALQAPSSYGGRSTLRTWLTGILLHRIADAARHERRQPRRDEPRPADDDAPAPLDFAVDGRDPMRLLEARQALAGVQASLQAMPPLAARAVLMREVDGLANDEIAQRLGLQRDRVPTLLHRARQRLRRDAAFRL
ncbi:MAG: hypothetical protein LKCHEGNO_00968 [Burkholderiaceae bacterium]|nr:hypothetical protein [Burkholderiaceae bacterium]